MDIKLYKKDNMAEVVLAGKLDTNSAPQAEPIFLKIAQEYDVIVLDLAQLSYISSAGLRVIKILYMALKKKDGELKLKNVNKMVMEVFEITGFAGLLTIE